MLLSAWKFAEEEEELRVQGPGVNEVSFHTRPHHNVHSTLGVDWKFASSYQAGSALNNSQKKSTKILGIFDLKKNKNYTKNKRILENIHRN
jgi:hypothetical protein